MDEIRKISANKKTICQNRWNCIAWRAAPVRSYIYLHSIPTTPLHQRARSDLIEII